MIPTRLILLLLLLWLPLAAQQRHTLVDGPLSGSYVVANGGGDFHTIGDAIRLLRSHGVDGPVTIEVRPGIYRETIVIDSIPGADSSHTITIRGIAGNGAMPVVEEALTDTLNTSPTVLLRNASWIALEGLHLKAGHRTRGVAIIDASHDVELIDCTIEGTDEEREDSTTGAAILVQESGAIRIERNRISNALIGIEVTPHLSRTIEGKKHRFVIAENRIERVFDVGIRLFFIADVQVTGNVIVMESSRPSASGIAVGSCSIPTMIERNVITLKASEAHGISIAESNPDQDTLPLRVVNNMVSVLLSEHSTPRLSAGISISDSRYVEVLHNSVLVRSGKPTTMRPTGLYLWGTSAAPITIINNIFAVTGGPALYWSGPPGSWKKEPAGIVCDYNDLFADGGPGVINASREIQPEQKLTLDEWRVISGADQHSFRAPPVFVDYLDLHLAGNATRATLRSAMPLPSVTDDVDGDRRDPHRPTVGADEPRR